MDLLIKGMLAAKIPIAKYDLKEYWLDIGNITDYEKAQEEYKIHFEGTN
jgi:NDP-sugar pyrophosphorylase family protein